MILWFIESKIIAQNIIKLLKVFVTGGAGFVGRHLVNSFLRKHQIKIYDDLSNSSESDIVHLLDRVDFVNGDILDYNTLKESCKEFDVVIHLAAKIDVIESITHPEITNKVNVNGTENVLNVCVENKIKKIIFASSAAVYGKNDHTINEESETNPLSPYGNSKLLAEDKIKSFVQKNNLDVIILRMFNVYGKGQTDQYAGVITKFTKNIAQNIPLEIYGDGEQTRDFISINDVVESYHHSLNNINGKKGKIYNIGTGESTSIIELAKIMIQISQKNLQIKYFNEKKDEIRHSVADVSLAKRDLGFLSETKLKDGLYDILGSISH